MTLPCIPSKSQLGQNFERDFGIELILCYQQVFFYKDTILAIYKFNEKMFFLSKFCPDSDYFIVYQQNITYPMQLLGVGTGHSEGMCQ